MDFQENQKFWRDHHNPARYLNAPHERTDALVELVKSLPFDKYNQDNAACILEIGCNSGRNLAALWKAGFHDLMGVEINPAAVRLFRDTFPDLNVLIAPSAVEDVIRQYPTGMFDLIYTMATLLHIPPASDWIFAEIARVSCQYVLTVECENSNAVYAGAQRQWSRNYKTIFESLGMHQVQTRNGFGDLNKYIMRLFEK